MHLRTIRSENIPSPQKQLLHYVFAIDVSGSMDYDLPRLREQLKNKLATEVKPGQAVSIIYYSSNGTCGIVIKGFTIENAESLTQVYNAIDSWLKPISLTGFVDPLKLTEKIVREALDQSFQSVFVFMSDGYENQNSESLVLQLCTQLAPWLLATYVVEYGDYANHNLLQKMAKAMNGQHLIAGELQDYNLVIDTVLGTKSFEEIEIVPQEGDLFAYTLTANGFVLAWKLQDEPIIVRVNPEYYVHVYNNKTDLSVYHPSSFISAALAAFNLGLIEEVNNILAYIGDRYLIDKFSAAIGKQRRNTFADTLRAFNEDHKMLYATGPRKVGYQANPAEPDIYDLFEVLSLEPGNKLLVRDKRFKYKRGGVKYEDVSDDLHKIEFTEQGGQSIDFNDIVLNVSRANLSFRGKFKGIVNVTNHPDNPDKMRLSWVATHIYRTYNIVRDGIVVMDEIPVYLRPDTIEALAVLDIFPIKVPDEEIWMINLAALPVANIRRVKDAVSGDAFVKLNYTYMVYQAYQKVFRYYQNQMELKKPSTEWLDRFGETGVKFLKSIGIDESNGFSPTNTVGIKSDFYYTPVINLKMAGYNSLPSVQDVIKRMDSGKELKNITALMANAIGEYTRLMLKPEPHLIINKCVQEIVNKKRNIEVELAGMVFAALLSRQEFDGFIDGKLTRVCGYNETLQVFNHFLTVKSPVDEIEFTLVEKEQEVAI